MREWLLENCRGLTVNGSAVFTILVVVLLGAWAIRRSLRPRQWMPWAMLVVSGLMLFDAWVFETPLFETLLRIAVEWGKAAVFVIFLELGMDIDWRRVRRGTATSEAGSDADDDTPGTAQAESLPAGRRVTRM